MANSQEKIKKIPNEPPDWWEQLTVDEKYNYYYTAYNLARDLYHENLNKMILLNAVKTQLEDSMAMVKLLKKNHRFGLGLSINAGLNQELKADVFTTMNFYINFLRGRIVLNPSIFVKVYSCLGGGIGLGFIVNF